MANSIDPDETAHQDLHCLERYLFWSSGSTSAHSDAVIIIIIIILSVCLRYICNNGAYGQHWPGSVPLCSLI